MNRARHYSPGKDCRGERLFARVDVGKVSRYGANCMIDATG